MDDFRLLLISRILRSFAMSFIFLVLPLYLKFLGYSVVEIGLIYVPFIVSAIFLPIILGNVGDRFGYKKALIITDSLMAISLLILSSYHSLFAILFAGIIGGYNISNGSLRGAFSPGQTALIANLYEKNRRIRILGYITLAAGLASVFGPALLLISNVTKNFYVPLLQFGVLIIVISIIPLFFIKENKHEKKESKIFSKNTFKFVWKILVINSLNGFAAGIFMPLLPLWLIMRYNTPTTTISIIFIIVNIGAALGAAFSGKFSEKIGSIKVASITRVVGGILLIVAAVSPLVFLFVVFYVVRSLINGFGTPARSMIVVNNVDSSDMGSASGTAGSVTRTAALSTSISGYLMDINVFSPLLIAGALQMVSGFLYEGFFRKIKD